MKVKIMKETKFLRNIFLGVLFALTQSLNGAQVINFDDVTDGTDISTHYPGLTFSCAGAHCASPSIFARQAVNPPSPPNTIAPNQTGGPAVINQVTGVIQIAIGCGATKVTVQAKSVEIPEHFSHLHAILVAQDTNGNIVGQSIGTQFDQFELLTVSSPNSPIKTVKLGVENDDQGNGTYAQFDDLTIECASAIPFNPNRFQKKWLGFALVVLAGFVIIAFRRRLAPKS